MRLETLIFLRRNIKAIADALASEIEYQEFQKKQEQKAQEPNIDQTIEYLKRRYANSK